jgi:hypothetical protein
MWVSFYFPLPATDRYRTIHSTKPDCSKLIRSTEDALVDGGLLKDDSLIFQITATKMYAHGDQTVGAEISIDLYGAVESENRTALKAHAKEMRRMGNAKPLFGSQGRSMSA